MARQGCRNHRLLPIFCLTLAFCGSFIGLQRCPADELSAAALDFRMELTWKSNAPRLWAGEVTVAGSSDLSAEPNRLAEPGNLTPGMLLSGGVQLSDDGKQLRFAPPPSAKQLRDRRGRFVPVLTTRGGISFRVSGRTGDRVIIALRRDDSNETAAPVAIELKDFAAAGHAITSQFNDTATWTLRRVEGDQLRVTLLPDVADHVNRPEKSPVKNLGTSLFWDDQKATISIATDRSVNEPLELSCETFSAGNRVVATQTWPLTIANGIGVVADAKWQPPTGDGSYELHWKLQRKTASRSVLGVTVPGSFTTGSLTNPMALIRGTNDDALIAESKATVVVLSRKPMLSTNPIDSGSMAVVGRIEPFGKSWSVSRLIPLRQATQFVSQSNSSANAKKTTFAGKLVAELQPGASWTHVLPVARVGARHRIVLQLPDGQPMKLGVSILDRSTQGGKATVIRDLTCVRTRLKSSQSEWLSLDVDYYPQSSSPQLVLVNRDSQQPARFEAIDVKIEGERSSDSATGSVAIDDTKAKPLRTALMHCDAAQWMETYGDLTPARNDEPIKRGNVFQAALRLAESIRLEGYSGVMMTVCEDGQSLFRTSTMTADRSELVSVPIASDQSSETLEMLFRLFDRESLVFVPCVRPNYPMTRLEQAIETGGVLGRGVAVTTAFHGQSLDLPLDQIEASTAGMYNISSELVCDQIVELMSELSQQCSAHRCVDKVGIIADEGSCACLPSARAMLDAGTLDRFHASLPADKIARSQMVAWSNNEGATAFKHWRRELLLSLYRKVVDSIENKSTNVMVVTTSDQPPLELWDISPESRLSLMRLYRRSLLEPLATRCRDEQTTMMVASKGETIESPAFRSALFLAPETMGFATDADKELVRQCNLTASSCKTGPLFDQLSSSSTVTKLLARSDRTCIAISGTVAISGSDIRRRSLARFQALPPVLMDEVVPTDEALKIVKLRRVVYEGTTYLAVTNHSRWPVAIDVLLTGASGLQSVLANEPSPKIDANGSWRASLEPGELLAVRVPKANSNVRVWSAQVEGDAQQIGAIGTTVREMADAIAKITEPKPCDCLENAGFEVEQSASTPSTQISGWLLAQHPAGCAVVDKEVAQEGKHSIRLSNRDGRTGGTWIVSRPIKPPTSGRIAVSLMVRGEPNEDPTKATPTVVRVAIEGMIAGSSMRQAKLINVPRDGKWTTTPCRVEVDLLPTCGVESLRLAIDVMSEGTVWIDNVKIEDSFMTETEKAQLQSQMFLSLGGISKGELSHAAKLLESHWVQYMLGLPIEPPRPAILPTSKPQDGSILGNDKDTTDRSTPGISERLKQWIPRPIRF